MSDVTQYGRTLYIEGLETGDSAKPLVRVRFSKKESEKSTAYDEEWLQRLIMEYPSLLPVDQIEPAFANLVPICIELPTPSGFVDNLFVTPDGNLALIECKLWRNPEARREVIGQIIEYAKDLSAWTYQKLQEAISRTTLFGGSNGEKTGSLYETVSSRGETDEAFFIDAVSRNLRRGRFLLLIVGDGIREGVESITAFLQQYAGLHFTLAIVELALFEGPTGGYIAQPRVLAKTTNIDRGIVTVDDEGRITIKPAAAPAGQEPVVTGTKMTITKELYLERLEKESPGISQRLNSFVDKLSAYDVLPDFGTESMILRWHPDGTKSWNFGTITSGSGHVGDLWMDFLGKQAQSAGLLDSFKKLLTDLAALVPNAYVRKTPKEPSWYVARDAKVIKVDALLADETRADGWVGAIAEFQTAVTKSLQGE
jgi:hypothetical protein